MRAPKGSAIETEDFSFFRRAEVAFFEPNKVYRTNAPMQRPDINRTFAAECKVQEQATWGLVRTAEQALTSMVSCRRRGSVCGKRVFQPWKSLLELGQVHCVWGDAGCASGTPR
jgi:hypothetical protein